MVRFLVHGPPSDKFHVNPDEMVGVCDGNLFRFLLILVTFATTVPSAKLSILQNSAALVCVTNARRYKPLYVICGIPACGDGGSDSRLNLTPSADKSSENKTIIQGYIESLLLLGNLPQLGRDSFTLRQVD